MTQKTKLKKFLTLSQLYRRYLEEFFEVREKLNTSMRPQEKTDHSRTVSNRRMEKQTTGSGTHLLVTLTINDLS